MRVITFSRFFQANHPRKGEETFFMEKIWKGLKTGNRRDGEYTIWSKYPRLMKAGYWQLPHLWRDQMCDKKFLPKYHTIREGNRWKVGDFFSPRIWSGLPYRSKQIQFAPPIEIKKIFKIEIPVNDWMYVNNYWWQQPYDEIATNDGLSNQDFIDWIIKPAEKKSFKGQILCWNNKIEY